MSSKKKLLLIRLDKIGDLICTLPVDQILDPELYEITWVIQKGLSQVIDLGSHRRNYIEIDKQDAKAGQKTLEKLIKKWKPDIAISFQCPWWVNWSLFKNKVQIRSGVYSQWHSFLFLNKGLRQKRSLAIKHEYDYNMDLVVHTLKIQVPRLFNYFQIQNDNFEEVLKKWNLTKNQFIIIHPGMMGSALNWTQSQYIQKIHELVQLKKQVVLTGTASDEPYLTEIKKEFCNHSKVLILQDLLNLKELVSLLSSSEYVIAPSTGVAHLAASAQAKVLAIYSPILVHHPKRWAPRGPYVEVFKPQVDCPARHHCLKLNCSYYNCMTQIKIP